ncbi:MAG: hypothetical protein Q8K67_11300 [Geothrix sp.]|nr:hypothetical protein [Geothrix sp.]
MSELFSSGSNLLHLEQIEQKERHSVTLVQQVMTDFLGGFIPNGEPWPFHPVALGPLLLDIYNDAFIIPAEVYWCEDDNAYAVAEALGLGLNVNPVTRQGIISAPQGVRKRVVISPSCRFVGIRTNYILTNVRIVGVVDRGPSSILANAPIQITVPNPFPP